MIITRFDRLQLEKRSGGDADFLVRAAYTRPPLEWYDTALAWELLLVKMLKNDSNSCNHT